MGGGKGGSRGGSERFAEQCEGLQGMWAETDKGMKRWVVTGLKAFRMTKVGLSNSSYTLCEGEDGGLVWGSNGVYVMDPAFKCGMSTVTWLKAGNKGQVAFVWQYVGPAADQDEEEAQAAGGAKAKGKAKGKGEAKGQAKGEAKGWAKGEAKGWAKGEAKGWAKGEAKGQAKGEAKGWAKGEAKGWGKGEAKGWEKSEDKGWGKGEAKGWGEAKTPAKADDSWWQDDWAAKAEWPASKLQEKRIDPGDKTAYTWEEFKAHYLAQGQAVPGLKEWWANMAMAPDKAEKGWPSWGQGGARAEPERRVDTDGKAYTWDELRAYYSSEFTKKASEMYWETLAPAPSKGKGKAKGKDKGQEDAEGSGSWWGKEQTKGKGMQSAAKDAKGKASKGKGKSKGY